MDGDDALVAFLGEFHLQIAVPRLADHPVRKFAMIELLHLVDGIIGRVFGPHDGELFVSGIGVEFDSDSTHKEFTVMGAEYSTDDSIDKVKEFYHRELPHWMISKSRHGNLQMEFTEEGYKRIVSIHEQDGKTRIGLASVGEPASN